MTGQSRRSEPKVNMNHFTLEEWADFARHLKNPSMTAQMQQHLDKGCKQCSKVVHAWRDLLAFGAGEAMYRPPDRALRLVRGHYGLLKPQRRGSRVAIMALLLFDSVREAIPASVRSSPVSPRQLVYAAGNLVIDLRLEPRFERVYVVGQAQSRIAANRGIAGIEVFALKGTQRVAQTISNRSGEFQLELQPEDDEGFSIVLKRPKSIVIPLRDLRSPQGGGSKLPGRRRTSS
jgi:hypothetical protein